MKVLKKTRELVLVFTFLFAASLFFNMGTAEAFKTNIHTEIDNKAFDSLGFPSLYRSYINQANVNQDLSPGTPQYHGDRRSGETHQIAFNRLRDYISSEKIKISSLRSKGDFVNAAVETGKALHAVQDFYSHSNFVEMSEQDRTTTKLALINPTKEMPSTVKMCGFWISFPFKPLPCTDSGSLLCPKDPLLYSHTNHNKDASGSPSGRPNDYSLANGYATQHTIEFLSQTWMTG
jgi:hypothetical protein